MPAQVDHPEVLAGEADPGPGLAVPQVDLAAVVAPQDVGLAVAVEVGRLGDMPAQVDHPEVLAGEADPGPGLAVPQVDLAAVVAPKEVGLAVAVEVGRLGD